MIRFVVLGVPRPKGSASAMVRFAEQDECEHCGRKGKPYAQVFPDNSKTRKWEKAVRTAAATVAPFAPTTNPVALAFEFRLPRPQNHYRTNGALKAWALTLFPIGRGVGDWDKLVRSTQDALEGLFFVDDSQVVECPSARKRYVMPGEAPGVTVVVQEIEIAEPAEQPELAMEARA